MSSSFERRSSVSNHHYLWIELERIELALEKDGANEIATAQSGHSNRRKHQLHLREALARLGN